MADAVVSLGLDPAQFEAGLRRAENSSGVFAQRLGGMLGRTLGAVFVGGSIMAAIDRAIDQVTSRRAAIQKALTGPESAGFRSGGDIQGNLSDTVKQIKGLTDLRNFDSSNRFRGVIGKLRDTITGETPKERDDAKAALRGQASQDIDALALRQGKLNEAQRQRQFGEERTADLLEEEAKWMDNLYQLSKAEAEAGVNNSAAREQETDRTQIAQNAINKRANLLNAEVQSEEKLNTLRGEGISQEKLALATLAERIRLKNYELHQFSESRERRDKLAGELTGLEADAKDALFGQADQSPDAVAGRNARNLENLRRRAFNTNLDQAMDPNRDAYGATISGLGAIGKQSSTDKTSGGLEKLLQNILTEIQKWSN